VEFRYDALPEEPEAPLNKGQVRRAMRELRAWINDKVATEEKDDGVG
jgi:hypothetical protein